jgi:hypothetical protein
MVDDRTVLKMDLDDFDDPAPKAKARTSTKVRKEIDKVSSFPSRETSQDGQLNLRAPQSVLDRFKGVCKADRRNYGAMLEILLDNFEKPGQGG